MEPLILTTSELAPGQYQVFANKQPTRVVIEKGEPSPFRHKQLWSIGVVREGEPVLWLANDQWGLTEALATLQAIGTELLAPLLESTTRRSYPGEPRNEFAIGKRLIVMAKR